MKAIMRYMATLNELQASVAGLERQCLGAYPVVAVSRGKREPLFTKMLTYSLPEDTLEMLRSAGRRVCDLIRPKLNLGLLDQTLHIIIYAPSRCEVWWWHHYTVGMVHCKRP